MIDATVKPVTELKRRMTELLDRLAILQGIAKGERAFAEGRVVRHRDARKRLSRWLPRARLRSK